MRESILNWYPFDPAGAVLELNADMGAVTGLLCERCARVVSVEKKRFKAKAVAARYGDKNNLTVINGDIADVLAITEPSSAHAIPRAFDYIVAIDPESLEPEYLRRLLGLLSPHGRLLLAAENRFALRYWCGKSSPKTGLPFAGPTGRDGLLSKEELSARLLAAGFAGLKWYYPLTDHLFAREIYSEAMPPNRFLNSRFAPYIRPDQSLIMNEGELYEDVIAGGAFKFMCNAYLAEARKRASDPACDVDYAALTTYRSAENRFATTVHSDGTARKTALRPEGMQRLEDMAKHHAALRERGINAIPVTLSKNAAVMPRVRRETLWDYWQTTLRANKFDEEAVIRTFDRLRDVIMASSECEPPGARGADPRLGPIQKTAYPELVPANCFYDPENDEFTFFDQEYAREYCPASVPLSRALLSLRYSPVFLSDARVSALLPRLIERYGLKDCWDLLEKTEDDFLRSVFNFEATEALETETAKARAVIRMNMIENECKKIAVYVQNRWKRIGLYGYGKRGGRLYARLRAEGTEIAFLIDRAAANAAPEPAIPSIFESLDAVPPNEVFEAVIVTPKADGDAIAEDLRGMVNCPVATFDEILSQPVR
jgi:hypothetical protein